MADDQRASRGVGWPRTAEFMDCNPGEELIRRLRQVAWSTRDFSDRTMLPRDVPAYESEDDADADGQLEGPGVSAVVEAGGSTVFGIYDLAPRAAHAAIDAYCDGTRATQIVGYQGVYPLFLTCNEAVVRRRDPVTGYHQPFMALRSRVECLLAPFGLFPPAALAVYRRLGLVDSRHGDLCAPGDDGTRRLLPSEQRRLSSSAWCARAMTRARFLMLRSESAVSLSAARTLGRQHPDGSHWLLKDGPIGLAVAHSPRYPILGCVKRHTIPYFGTWGERLLASMAVGQRSSAFRVRRNSRLADRPGGGGTVGKATGSSSPLECPAISWYLRVHEPRQGGGGLLSGVVRLEIGAFYDWSRWIDPLSWGVLDEFYGLSARPDSRHDVLIYGVYDCECCMRARRGVGPPVGTASRHTHGAFA